MEDAAIVELYWQRSDQAIAETEQKYGRYCRSIAGRICRRAEDAEECVSDTWFRAWNLMPDKRPSRLSVFLGTITRSLALDRIKAETRQKRGGGETDLALDELTECLPGGESAETLDDTRLTALGWMPDGAAYDYYRDDGTDPCPSADQITRITAAAGPSLRRSFTAPKDFPECRIPDPAE